LCQRSKWGPFLAIWGYQGITELEEAVPWRQFSSGEWLIISIRIAFGLPTRSSLMLAILSVCQDSLQGQRLTDPESLNCRSNEEDELFTWGPRVHRCSPLGFNSNGLLTGKSLLRDKSPRSRGILTSLPNERCNLVVRTEWILVSQCNSWRC
jgi:hypothetical protein